ncbi:MAG: hypothetical protein MZU97_02460 [Bacillus subtilis]|nr:hypothetical protein [Bacillus subtilis]
MKKIKEYLKYSDTITVKLLMLALFITVIPLIVVANLSKNIIHQSLLENAKDELNFNIILARERYSESLNNLEKLLSDSFTQNINNAYQNYKKTGQKQELTQIVSNFKKDAQLDVCLIISKSFAIVLIRPI